MVYCHMLICLLFFCGFGQCIKKDAIRATKSADKLKPGGVTTNCWNFDGKLIEKKAFTSVNYPSIYPNNTDCTQVLQAPKGYIIQLDFRDSFEIEYSENCEYDFLELRDGPFGYSPFIGKYCGQNHPPMIESSSNYLWIRFKSDDSIEYSGFNAVYEFIEITVSSRPKGDSVCKIDNDISLPEQRIHSSDVHKAKGEHTCSNNSTVDCTFLVMGDPNTRVFIDWEAYKMDAGKCEENFIYIYEGTTSENGRVKQMCGAIAKPYRSNHHRVYIRVFASNCLKVPTFSALITVFQQGPCDELPGGSTQWFDCESDGESCIDSSLVCNGNMNCNYRWDEAHCLDKGNMGESERPLMRWNHVIILSVVGVVLLSIICVSLGITCRQHCHEARRRKMALHQVERRAVETEMATLHNGSPRSGHLRSDPRGSCPNRQSESSAGFFSSSAHNATGSNSIYSRANGNLAAANANHAATSKHKANSGTCPSNEDGSDYYFQFTMQTRPPIVSNRGGSRDRSLNEDKYISPGTTSHLSKSSGHLPVNQGVFKPDTIDYEYADFRGPSTIPKIPQKPAYYTPHSKSFPTQRPDVVQEPCGYEESPRRQLRAEPTSQSLSAYYDDDSYIRKSPHVSKTLGGYRDNMQALQPYKFSTFRQKPLVISHSPSEGGALKDTERRHSIIKRQGSLVSYLDTNYVNKPINSTDANVHRPLNDPKSRNEAQRHLVAARSLSVDDSKQRTKRSLSVETKNAPIPPDIRQSPRVPVRRQGPEVDMFYFRPNKNVKHALV